MLFRSRRILTMLIFNVKTTSVFPDDDGNAAGAATLTDEQIEAMQSLIVEVGADIGRFCKFMRVDRIDQIPASKFDAAMRSLEAKRGK